MATRKRARHWRGGYSQRKLRARWLYAQICARPGRTIRQIERDTHVLPGSLYSLLGGLDKHGLLVYEDECGRIYPLLCD